MHQYVAWVIGTYVSLQRFFAVSQMKRNSISLTMADISENALIIPGFPRLVDTLTNSVSFDTFLNLTEGQNLPNHLRSHHF